MISPGRLAWAKFLVAYGTIDRRWRPGSDGGPPWHASSTTRTFLKFSLPDLDDTLTLTDLFLDGGNPQGLEDLFAHLHDWVLKARVMGFFGS